MHLTKDIMLQASLRAQGFPQKTLKEWSKNGLIVSCALLSPFVIPTRGDNRKPESTGCPLRAAPWNRPYIKKGGESLSITGEATV